MASDIILDIELGSSKQVLKDLKDLTSYVENLGDAIDDIDKNLPEQLTGADKTALKKMTKDVSTLSGDVSGLLKDWDKWGDAAGDTGKQIKQSLEAAKTQLGSFSNELVQAMENAPASIRDMADAQSMLVDQLDIAEESYRKLRDAQLTTSDPQELEAYGRQMRMVSQSIEEMEEALVRSEQAQLALTRTGGEFFDQYSTIGELQEFIYGFPEGLETAERQQQALLKSNEAMLSSIQNLRTEQEQLIKMRQDAYDPAIIAVLDQKLADVNERLETQNDLLVANSTADTLAEMLEKEADRAENYYEYQNRLQEEMRESEKELKKIHKLMQTTYDPDKLDLLAKKEDEINKELEERNKLLQRQAELQKRAGTAGGMGSGPGGQRQAQMFGALQGVLGTAQSFSSTLEGLGVNLKLANEETDRYGRAIEGTGFTVTDAIGLMSNTATDIQTSFERVASIQNDLGGMSRQLGNWSGRIADGQKALQASGKGLGRFNKFVGMAGKGAGIASKGLAGLAKAAGPIGAVIEGVSLGFNIYDRMMGRSAEQIERNIEAIREEMNERERLNDIIESGSIDAVNGEIEALREQIQAQREYKEEVRNNAVQLTSTTDQLRTIIGHTLFNDPNIYGRAADEMNNVNDNITELEARLAELADEGFRAQVALQAVRNELEAQADSIGSTVERREKELFDAQVAMLNAEQQYQEDMLDLQTEYDAESLAIEEAREQADIAMHKEHIAELEAMEATYNEEIVNMRDEHLQTLRDLEESYIDDLADMIQEHNEAIADMEAEFRKDLADTIKDYNDESVDKREDYDKRIAKMEEDFNKERIKRQKDLEAELFEAEMDNDALRYFMLQRQGEQEEKEAQEQHADALNEEQKAFQEEQAEREKAHKENLAQMKKEHAERKQEMKDEHTERLAERKKQFDEEMALEKQGHEERMREALVAYQQERAQAVQRFREKQEEIAQERRIEDEARIRRLAEQRQHLEDSFQQELDYFENREKALSEFIDRANVILQSKENVENLLATGRGTVTQEEATVMTESVWNELHRLMQTWGDSADWSQEQHAQFHALSQVLDSFAVATDGGGDVDITDILNDPYYARIAADVQGAIMDGLTTGLNEQLVNLDEEMSIDLTYFDDLSRESAQMVQDLQAQGETVYDNVTQDHQALLDDLNLQETEHGMQRQAEMEEQAQLQADIIEQQGTETLGELEETATNMGDEIIQNWEETANEELQAQQDRMQANEDWLNEREGNETQFEDDLLAATQQANDQMLADQDAFNEAEKANEAAAFQALEEQQLEQNDAQLENQEDFMGDRNELLDTQNEEDLERQVLQNEEETALAEEQHEAEMEREEENFKTAEELAQEQFEAEMERMQMQFEMENELWVMFMDNLTKLFEAETRNMFRDLQRTTNMGTNQIVQTHAQMINAIVQTAASGLNQLMAYIAKAAQASSGSWGSGGGSSSPGWRGSPGGGLLAAKGALIDQPTLMIAGEGENPELVIPFDESKGIPDDAMRSFAQAITGTQSGMFPSGQEVQGVGGGMSDQLLMGILSAVQNMQAGMELKIDHIEVGSNVSREEIRDQIRNMQTTLIDVMHERVNVQ